MEAVGIQLLEVNQVDVDRLASLTGLDAEGLALGEQLVKLLVGFQQIIVVEIALQGGEEFVDVVLGDLVVEFDDLLCQQIPVDDLIRSAFIRLIENVRAPPAIHAVGFPPDSVEPCKE